MKFISTKVIPLGSTAFRQWRAESHCNKIHGYRLQCKVWFTADSLDNKNWVYDFGSCKAIKTILEHQFDHTTIVAADDPELDLFKTLNNKGIIDLRVCEKGVGIERTAEWVFNTVNEYVKRETNERVSVIKVEVWEHEGNSAIYEDDGAVITNIIEPEPEIKNIPEQRRTPPLYGIKSTGLNDPFKGTSWGNNR